MAADDVFPAEMPDDPSQPTLPLDDDTAERLLAGRLHPEDAPPGYASVASLLRAAAGPPTPDELAGQDTALAMFRSERRRQGPVGVERRPPAAVGSAATRPRWGPGAAPVRWRPGAAPRWCGRGWSRWRWPGRWSPVRWGSTVGRWRPGGCGSPMEPEPPLG
jgi:hypothetical protein